MYIYIYLYIHVLVHIHLCTVVVYNVYIIYKCMYLYFDSSELRGTQSIFFRKFFYQKSPLILVYMGLRFFPLSSGGSCPNPCSISKRIIFLQTYLARGTFSRSTLTRNCYYLYHFSSSYLFVFDVHCLLE